MRIVHSQMCLQEDDLSFSSAVRFCCLFFVCRWNWDECLLGNMHHSIDIDILKWNQLVFISIIQIWQIISETHCKVSVVDESVWTFVTNSELICDRSSSYSERSRYIGLSISIMIQKCQCNIFSYVSSFLHNFEIFFFFTKLIVHIGRCHFLNLCNRLMYQLVISVHASFYVSVHVQSVGSSLRFWWAFLLGWRI